MKKLITICTVTVFILIGSSGNVMAGPSLGSAQSFAVLGHESVTNAHVAGNTATQVYGNLGVTPGTSVTGFNPDGTVSGGTIYKNNESIVTSALTDAGTAYTTLAGLSGTSLTGTNLGDYHSGDLGALAPGVYTMTDSVAYLNGTLTLDATGVSNARFVFNLAAALTTGNTQTAVVNVIGGDSGTEVYWVIGSTATLGDDTVFAGNILAHTTVILDPRAEILCGRAFALTGSVTLIDNLISNNNFAQDFGSGRDDFRSYGFSGGSATAVVPVPGAILLGGIGVALVGWLRSRRTL